MAIARFDSLVSPAAHERWRRWSQDLIVAERKEREAEAARYRISPAPSESEHDPLHLHVAQERRRKHHAAGMAEALVNDAQPVSPPASDDREILQHSSSPSRVSSAVSIPQMYSGNQTPEISEEWTDPYGPPGILGRPSANPFMNSSQSVAEVNVIEKSANYGTRDGGYSVPGEDEFAVRNDDSLSGGVPLRPDAANPAARSWQDGQASIDHSHISGLHCSSPPHNNPTSIDDPSMDPGQAHEGLHAGTGGPGEPPRCDGDASLPPPPAPDAITDTVGAIAIDMYGNIACGASSGGIGMKHRGRIGPAALVGIGASIIPVDPDDPERTTVATVTSGTGEHMGTTMAASVCSNRVFFSQRRTPGGGTEQVTEDEALKGFIERDFMGHPSVRNSNSTGAIGMLTVKRTADGAWLYYGHNTDSFAIASMSSEDSKPACSVSRSRGGGTIAQGGKAIRFRKRK